MKKQRQILLYVIFQKVKKKKTRLSEVKIREKD